LTAGQRPAKENKAASQPGRASHRPSASSKQQQSEACSRQQAAAGSRPASRQQTAEGSAPRSQQPASSSQKLSTATQPRAKQGITRSASLSPGENPEPSAKWHVACTGIRHPPGRHPSDKQATPEANQEPAPRTHKKIRQEVSGFFLMLFGSLQPCAQSEQEQASQHDERIDILCIQHPDCALSSSRGTQ
jgi:hypothetical protein